MSKRVRPLPPGPDAEETPAIAPASPASGADEPLPKKPTVTSTATPMKRRESSAAAAGKPTVRPPSPSFADGAEEEEESADEEYEPVGPHDGETLRRWQRRFDRFWAKRPDEKKEADWCFFKFIMETIDSEY